MAKIHKTQPKPVHVSSKVSVHSELREDSSMISPTTTKRPLIVFIVVVILVGAFLYAKRSWFIAAVVDGKPIFTWDLNKALQTRYGAQTLEGMIGEILIADQAKKNNITITNDSLDARQKEILDSLGANVKLDDLLKYQGLTKEEFGNQLKLQMTVEKILTKDLTISDSDIDTYIASNRATLTATDPAKIRDEAKKAIVNNTVTEKLQTWFADIRAKAKIFKFL
jgi:hypothetical protein